jgi:signal transduction histidine kinase
MRSSKVRQLATRESHRKAITGEEESKLAAACGLSRSRALVVMFLLALYTGARFGVVRRLTWGNVDFARRRLRWGKDKTTSGDHRYQRLQMGWSKLLLAKIPEPDREEAEALVSRESDRLTAYVRRLEERQAQLEARVTLGLIIGELLHQGNTPLSFLETESERLNRWWPRLLEPTSQAVEKREEVPHILRGLVSSASKLRVLFKALSPLSGARRGRPFRYDPCPVIEQTHYLFRSRMEAIGISYTFEAPSTCEIFGYSDDLATALTNLFENAVYWLEHRKSEAPEIRVTVVTDSEDSRCLITVADNGPGIPIEFAEQIFDIGFTLKPNGTGLGLSIAKESVQRSNGDLRLLESHVGTTFQISMPSGE